MSNTLTTKEFIIKAHINNSDIQVVGVYVNSRTNIDVICRCGEHTDVRPHALYKEWKCFKCAIKLRKYKNGNGGWSTKRGKEAHTRIIEAHKETLSKKLPHLELVGEYVNSSTKVEYRCKIHNTTKLYTPHSILHREFGCEACELEFSYNRKFGSLYYKDKPTYLYYIKIKGYWKIGVCLYKKGFDKDFKNRYKEEFKSLSKIEIIKYDFFEDGAEAFKLEQRIIRNNMKYKYEGSPILIKGGDTELFIKDIKYEF